MIRASSALAALFLATAAFAADGTITVEDAYARSSAPSPTGAAFMILTNSGTGDDRLIAVASDAAERVEIHTHIEDANGVMRMVRVEDGIALPAGEMHMLERGGDHVMLMGLTRPLETGDEIEITLTFEAAGQMTITVPVDNERMGGAHMHSN